MTNERKGQFGEPVKSAGRNSGIQAGRPPFVSEVGSPGRSVRALGLFHVVWSRRRSGRQPHAIAPLIDQQVGGIEKLRVPANDADLPQPRLSNGSLDPRFQSTEAKRYLGKMLFFDPVRTVRILPEFGGVPATMQTGSCGSCHMGEAAGKPARF
jgi:cytochrome c peroxidase